MAARVAWLVVGAVLLFFGLDAHAAVTCPPGKVPKFKIATLANASVVGYNDGTIAGAVGDEITQSVAAARTSFITGGGSCTGSPYNYTWNRISNAVPYDPYNLSHHYIWGADGATGTRAGYTYGGTCSDNINHNPNGGYAGIQIVEGCGVAVDPCPAAGTPYTGNKNLKNAFGTIGYIQEGPDKVCEVVGGGGVCMTVPGGVEQGTYCPEWTYSGNDGAVASELGNAPSETTDSVCAGDYCVSKTASNCGTVNGEYMCLGSPAPGGCVTTAGGYTVCTSNASTPLTTPPAPENPTAPGTVAQPVAQFVKPDGFGGVSNSGQTTNVFLPGGAAAPGGEGTPTGTPSGEEGEGQALCGGPGQPLCATDIDCGGEGEPKCGVKIDETGTSEAWAALFDNLTAAEADFEAQRTAQATVLNNSLGSTQNPGFGWDPGALFPEFPENTCTTIEIEFFNGETKAFPTPALCDAIETWFKPTLAFFLYLWTLMGCVVSGMKSATGNT